MFSWQLFGDILWYCGHILCGIAIIITHFNYWACVGLVISGQLLTIISRPIGRIKIKKNKEKSKEQISTNGDQNV